MDNEPKKKINTDKEGIKIIKIAAFCFAIISFIATAEGLSNYVFEYSWQAYMISFAIQSILFVFNLKLPSYFAMVQYSSKIKSFFVNTIILIFYIMIIGASSWFSYIFIVNVVYEDTQYMDSNIILDSNYRKFLDDTENFVTEDIKITQMLISNQLSSLNVPQDNKSISQEDLQNQKTDLELDLADKKAQQEFAQEILNNTKKIYETPMDVRWRSIEEYKQEFEAYMEATEKLKQAKNEYNKVEKKLKDIKYKIDNYKPSYSASVEGFLSEILKQSPELEDYEINGNIQLGLKSYIKILNDYIIDSKDEIVSTDSFFDIVVKTESLNILVGNYIELRQCYQKDGENNDIEDFKKAIIGESIKIPTDHEDNESIQQWIETWQDRMINLEQLIKNIPNYDVKNNYKEIYHDAINFESLELYDKQHISDTIDNLVRENISSINKLERAVNLLGSKYPFLAYFSLIIAIFFDCSSLLAGLFVYSISKKKKQQKESQLSI